MAQAEPDINALLAQANNALQAASGAGANIDANALNMNPDDMQLTADDMNDPDLLAQLAEFGDSGDDLNDDDDDDGDEKIFEELKSKAIQQLKQQIGLVKQKIVKFNSLMDKTNAAKCQICIKQLQKVYSDINSMDAIDYATDKDEYDAKIKKIWNVVSLLKANQSSNVNIKHQSKQSTDFNQAMNDINNDNNEEANENALLERYKMYRFAAKNMKDAGNKTDAIKYLKQSKIIKQQIEQIREGIVVWMDDVPPKLQDSLWNNIQLKSTKTSIAQNQKSVTKSVVKPKPVQKPNNLQQNIVTKSVQKPLQKPQQKAINPPITVASNQTNDNGSGEYATIDTVSQRIQNYKIACVAAKNAGNIDIAKGYLKELKEMKKMIPYINNGQLKILKKDLPPELRDGKGTHVVSNNNNVKQDVVTNLIEIKKEPQQRRLSSTEQNEYIKLIKQLKLQIEECKSNAAYLKSGNDKDDNLQSLELLKYVKESTISLQKVLQCQKKLLVIPQYEIFSIKLKSLNINNDIESNELRLCVCKLTNLSTKGTIDVYVTLKAENKLFETYTATKRAKFGCDFGLKKRCKIVRDKRLKNKIKFCKVKICLYQKRFLRDELLGEGTLKLKPLINESSIDTNIVLKNDNTRKKIADLNVKILLRQPVVAEGFSIITKKLIKVTHYPVDPMQYIQSKPKPKPQSKPQQRQQIQQRSKPAATAKVTIQAKPHNAKPQPNPHRKTKPKSQVKPQAKPQSKPQAKPKAKVAVVSNLPAGLTQDIVDNPLGVQYVESFECMSKEIELCKQEIIQKGKSVSDDIKDRLQALTTNKMILETQVSGGLLTLEQYTAKIKKAMIVDLTLAKYLKSQNRKMEAGRVFQRFKLMKKEIEG